LKPEIPVPSDLQAYFSTLDLSDDFLDKVRAYFTVAHFSDYEIDPVMMKVSGQIAFTSYCVNATCEEVNQELLVLDLFRLSQQTNPQMRLFVGRLRLTPPRQFEDWSSAAIFHYFWFLDLRFKSVT